MSEDLTKLFNHFVGKELKHPGRVTCDMDPVMSDLEWEARQKNLFIQLCEEGQPPRWTPPEAKVLQVHVKENKNRKLEITHFTLG